ncbi:hypothetical protein HanRHA438_Chr11g0511461 [Helianthus annuus]|nr:hypothetical protein HanIR_Chr11g0536971 [Helianthus annuus]KAJ0871363.1 hypothetical protein HanRHA438_Chr11g0511461 [Helianthus annuus]
MSQPLINQHSPLSVGSVLQILDSDNTPHFTELDSDNTPHFTELDQRQCFR